MGELVNALQLINTAIFFDMDGVLAKWENNGDPRSKGFFLSRELEEKMKDLAHSLKADGYNVAVLSAVYEDTSAVIEKAKWLEENGLGDIPHLFVPYGSDKSKAVSRHAGSKSKFVLIDDFTANLDQWDAAGHTGIKFLNGVNNTKGTWTGRKKPAISKDMSIDEMKSIILKTL